MKVGIVSDRPLLTHTLHRAVSLEPTHRVGWIAESESSAVELCAADPPDVVLLVMPTARMDGADVAGRITLRCPCPVLIVTEALRTNRSVVLEAMHRGAVDMVAMPTDVAGSLAPSAAALLTKIDAVSTRRAEPRLDAGASAASRSAPRCDVLVAIGASAGGPAAVATVLKGLPKAFAAGIVVVQHVDDMWAPGMAAWIAEESGRPVVVPKEGERITADRVMVAGAAGHLVVHASGRVGYTPEPRDSAYRPSVDVFFRSVSRLWRGSVVGVLLTGMGSDGAAGLKELRDIGHHTIAQDQASCVVYGMPKAAAALHAAVEVLPLNRIAARLDELVSAGVARPAR